MKMFIYILISTIECLAIYKLLFNLFRFRLRDYFIPMLFVSTLFSYSSYVLRIIYDLAPYVPFVFMLLSIVYMYMICRFPLKWVIIMFITSYVLCFVISIILTLPLYSYFGLEIAQPHKYFEIERMMQLIDIIVIFLISHWLYKKRWGFTFKFEPSNHEDLYLLKIGLVSIVGIGTLMAVRAFYWLSFFCFVSLILLLYLAVRKEIAFALLRAMRGKSNK